MQIITFVHLYERSTDISVAIHSRPASEEAYGRRPFGIGTMATADRKIQTGLRDNRPSVRKRKDREHHPAV